jgi:hypothetical protein
VDIRKASPPLWVLGLALTTTLGLLRHDTFKNCGPAMLFYILNDVLAGVAETKANEFIHHEISTRK